MKKDLHDALTQSLKEAAAIARGELTPTRRWRFERRADGALKRSLVDGDPAVADARVARERLKLSQSEFARLIGVSVRTLQNWEQRRRKPAGPAAALIRVAQKQPRAVLTALHE
jgi:putative transcriptional regulator